MCIHGNLFFESSSCNLRFCYKVLVLGPQIKVGGPWPLAFGKLQQQMQSIIPSWKDSLVHSPVENAPEWQNTAHNEAMIFFLSDYKLLSFL